MKLSQKEFMDSLNYYGKQLDDFNNEVKEIKKSLKSLDTLKANISQLQKENVSLRDELNHLQQYSRINNVEITGIPENKGENIVSILQKIGEVAGCVIQLSDVDACHRIPKHGSGDNPRSLVVKFISRLKKEELMMAAKKKGVTTSDLGFGRSSSKVYVNDHLTLTNKILFKKTREMCKEKSLKYCWTKEGRILVRKNDISRVIHIRSEDDLTKFQ